MEINVRRIFFETDKSKTFSNTPIFELEDGTYRRPVLYNNGSTSTFIWCSDEEIAEQKRRKNEKEIAEQKRRKNEKESKS